VIVQEQIPGKGRNSNIFKKKVMSERWGQKNESSPLRSKRRERGALFFCPYFSDILFVKNRK
jgi:hypothetical protein